jgi:hypothetical protein
VLLAKKAKEIRKRTGDEKYHAAIESQKMTLSQRLETILARPFKILFREPMLIAITLYMSVSAAILKNGERVIDIGSQFVYGCIYLLFEAYPVVFTKGHNLNAGVSGLMFLPLPIGGFLAVATVCIFHPCAFTFLSHIFSTFSFLTHNTSTKPRNAHRILCRQSSD